MSRVIASDKTLQAWIAYFKQDRRPKILKPRKLRFVFWMRPDGDSMSYGDAFNRLRDAADQHWGERRHIERKDDPIEVQDHPHCCWNDQFGYFSDKTHDYWYALSPEGELWLRTNLPPEAHLTPPSLIPELPS